MVPQRLGVVARPAETVAKGGPGDRRCRIIAASHPELGDCLLYGVGNPPPLFTDNDTNNERIFGTPNRTPYIKDGINDYVAAGRHEAVNPNRTGTKAAAHYKINVGAGETSQIRLRLCWTAVDDPFGGQFDQIIEQASLRSRCILSGDRPFRRHRRCRQCNAAGAGGNAVEQAVLFSRCRQVAGGTLCRSDTALQQPNSQPRVVPPDRRSRDVDAGQMGISLVRRLGPGLSYPRAIDSRHRFREGAAPAAARASLPASHWPGSRL